jgi:hypothetical protein
MNPADVNDDKSTHAARGRLAHGASTSLNLIAQLNEQQIKHFRPRLQCLSHDAFCCAGWNAALSVPISARAAHSSYDPIVWPAFCIWWSCMNSSG